MQQVNCPICHQNDRLMKVTAVINQGDYTVVSSKLSDRLRMRSEPPAPSNGLGGLLLVVAILCAFGTVFNLLSAAVPGGAISPNDALPGAIGYVVVGVICFVWSRRRTARYAKQYAAYSIEYKQWQAGYARWQTLYYCSRDDVVVSPTDNRYAPIGNWEVLLTLAPQP